MNPTEMPGKIGESFVATATVRSVYGEPIHAEGKTIIPVAKIAYGFGAGGGSPKQEPASDKTSQGGGGGGRVRALPAGVLEITQAETRFVPFADHRLLLGVFAAGVLLGGLFLRRRR